MGNSPARPGDDGGASAIHVDTVDAFENLVATEETVLIDFYAVWCGPCWMMAPTVDELVT